MELFVFDFIVFVCINCCSIVSVSYDYYRVVSLQLHSGLNVYLKVLVPVSFSPFQSNRPIGLLQRATKRNKKNPGGEQPGYDTSKNQLKHYPMQDAYFLFSEVSLSNCYHWID